MILMTKIGGLLVLDMINVSSGTTPHENPFSNLTLQEVRKPVMIDAKGEKAITTPDHKQHR